MLNEIYRMLDPVAFAVGPFVVRWYGIAYVAGFVCAALVLWQVAKQVVEPSSAIALAAVLQQRETFAGLRVGIILSGGNVDLDALPW